MQGVNEFLTLQNLLWIILMLIIGALLLAVFDGATLPRFQWRSRSARPATMGGAWAAPASEVEHNLASMVVPPLPVMSLRSLASALNVAIIGPKSSGKTTMLRVLLSTHTGYCESFDPHNEPGKWPVPVVGGGEKFATIHA